MAEINCVSGMSSVRFGPSSCWPLVEKSLAVGALLAIDDPRGDAVGKVTGMAFVIEGELLEGLITGIQRIEFEIEIPRSITSRTRDGRCVTDWLVVGSRRIVGVGWRGRHKHRLRRDPFVSI